MKRIVISFIAVLLTFIGVTFAVSAIILNSDKILNNFSIINVDNVAHTFNINFEKVGAANYYEIVVYNDLNMEVYSKTINKTNASIDLEMIKYNEEYKIVIYAYDKLGASISNNNPYTFTYTEPTFGLENDLILVDDKDYKVLIDGEINKKNYLIRLLDNGNKLEEEKLVDNFYVIDNKYYSGLEKKIDVEIIDGNVVIAKMSLYNKISPVSDIVINTPENEDILDYNDITLTYTGGDNATSYILEIYNGDRLIKESVVKRNKCIIASSLLEKAQNYTINVKALYKDYEEHTKVGSVSFTMNEKDTLKPVYIDYNPKYIKSGTEVVLHNPNDDGTIYYTVDGSDPVVSGNKYTGGIIINGNMTLKAVIMEPNKNNSIVSDFDFNVDSKKKYSVYLSPSNQDGNLGVESTGYTNEAKEMNDLTNYLEKRLKDAGVVVYRNSPLGNINLWVSDSRYYGVDLHFAIHSNASINHDKYGIETWINEEASKTYSLANLIQNALLSIYYNEDVDANRGVKYANGSLAEVGDAVSFGILVEVAHHDEEQDAAWIIQNKEFIANKIADAIIKYFGIN
ncbi:MAG: chitobiase/beta-hexosaminidase C-terminal domain-containing protein [Bacilli bacterium]|nr:chitobiase/beta-hexosaminidase C-terminal domain-containing protein [Bacilli bacterium]